MITDLAELSTKKEETQLEGIIDGMIIEFDSSNKKYISFLLYSRFDKCTGKGVDERNCRRVILNNPSDLTASCQTLITARRLGDHIKVSGDYVSNKEESRLRGTITAAHMEIIPYVELDIK